MKLFNCNVTQLALALLLGLLTPAVFALEVDREVSPEITLGGRVLATPTYSNSSGAPGVKDDSNSDIDIADSSLLFRFDKRLYNAKWIAGAIVGLTIPDRDSDLDDDVYFHQFFGFIQGKRFQTILGRTRLHNTLIEFPTLRDDDLIDYTHVPNASSFATNDQYQIFGTQMSFDWFLGNRNNAISVWLSGRTETDATGTTLDEFNLNTFGFGWKYEVNELLRYVKRLRHAGIIIDIQDIDGVTGDDTMRAVIGGAEWNLNKNPTKNWSMAVQAIFNEGIDGSTIATFIGRARSKYRSLTTSLRYTGRPKLLTRWQAAVTFAYKDFSDFNSASQMSITPSYVFRLGQGIDFVAQYTLTKRDDALAAAVGFEKEQVIRAGIIFSFDHTFNKTVGERDSILNVEHGYIR